MYMYSPNFGFNNTPPPQKTNKNTTKLKNKNRNNIRKEKTATM